MVAGISVGILAALIFGLFAVFSDSTAQANPAGKNITVVLDGVGKAYKMDVPETTLDGGPVKATCFDVDMFDLATGHQIGTATDCLVDIVGIVDSAGEPTGGMSLTGTTFFHLPGGTLVSRGRTTVQPILDGSVDFTHITGAIPYDGENSILEGTGRFAGASGAVRLSGAVNLSDLGSELDGEVVFNCIFVIDLD